MKKRVGYIGLGLMGKPMALNIFNAGYPLTVHNRSRDAVDELVAAGVEAAGFPERSCRRKVTTCSPTCLTLLMWSPSSLERMEYSRAAIRK